MYYYNNLDKVIKQLITTLRAEKDEVQRQRLICIIKTLKAQAPNLVDSQYLRAGSY